jgi:hypothetical protein
MVNMEAGQSINIDLTKTNIKPIFADEAAVIVKLKASKNQKGEIEKEGQIGIIFIDMMKQKPVGEFVITRITAKALSTVLLQNIGTLEKELKSKEMPKAPPIKTTTDTSAIR